MSDFIQCIWKVEHNQPKSFQTTAENSSGSLCKWLWRLSLSETKSLVKWIIKPCDITTCFELEVNSVMCIAITNYLTNL
jgi:hypothetical protein